MAKIWASGATQLALARGDMKTYLVSTVLAFIIGTAAIAALTFVTLPPCTSTVKNVYTCELSIPLLPVLIMSILIEGAGLAAIGLRRHRNWSWFGVRRPDIKQLVKLVSIGVFLLAISELLTVILGNIFSFFRQPEYGGLESVLSGSRLLIFGLYAVIIAPILEEVLFRGLYFRAIWIKTGPMVAAVLSSLLFSLVHGVSGASLTIFILGLYLCYMYKKSGSIVPGMVLHAVNNFMAIILLSLGVK